MSQDLYYDYEEWASTQPAERYLGQYKLDPRCLPELLGVNPPRSTRLPLDPVRKAIKRTAEAWLDLHHVHGITPRYTAQQLRESSAALRTALVELYVHLKTYDARRCPTPIPRQFPCIRVAFADLSEELHLALPGAPRLDIELVFTGKDVPEDELDSASVLEMPLSGL